MIQGRIIAVVGLLFALFLLVTNTFYVVYPARTGLVTSFGKPVKVVIKPGLNIKIPFVQQVEMFDARVLEYRMPQPMELNASDQKRIVVGAFLKWRITDTLKFAQSTRGGLGVDRVSVMNDRIATILESSLRQALGSYPLAALLSPKRATIMQEIKNVVNQQSGFGIEIADVRIVRADLPRANSDAIFRRMQTERDREAKQFRAEGEEEGLRIRAKSDRERTILLAEAEKKAETLRGEGDAEAAKIYANSFSKDPRFYEFYRTMQAYRRTLTSKDTTVILSPDSKFLKEMGNGE